MKLTCLTVLKIWVDWSDAADSLFLKLNAMELKLSARNLTTFEPNSYCANNVKSLVISSYFFNQQWMLMWVSFCKLICLFAGIGREYALAFAERGASVVGKFSIFFLSPINSLCAYRQHVIDFYIFSEMFLKVNPCNLNCFFCLPWGGEHVSVHVDIWPSMFSLRCWGLRPQFDVSLLSFFLFIINFL